MPEYGFSLTRIFPYKKKIEDFVLIQENVGQWKPVFLRILCSVNPNKIERSPMIRMTKDDWCIFALRLSFSCAQKNSQIKCLLDIFSMGWFRQLKWITEIKSIWVCCCMFQRMELKNRLKEKWNSYSFQGPDKFNDSLISREETVHLIALWKEGFLWS